MTERSSRTWGAVDCAIGLRIRTCRAERSLSQSALAAELGLTFQQVQKYESGANRVAASRLVEIARILGMPLSALLPVGIESATSAETLMLSELVTTKDGLRLCKAFNALRDPRLRRTLVALVEEVSRAKNAL